MHRVQKQWMSCETLFYSPGIAGSKFTQPHSSFPTMNATYNASNMYEHTH